MRFHLSCSQHGADDVDAKTDRIRAAWTANDRIAALRIAARFF
jgi:hypothetical protein